MENSKKNKWFYLISLLLITANIAVLAILFIHRGGHDRPQHNPPPQQGSMFEYLTKELSLTKEQQAAYDSMRTEHHENSVKLQDSMRVAKDALFSMLQQSNVSEEAITAQANKIAAFSSQLDILTYHHFQKLRAICTPEQQKKFDDVIQDAIRNMIRPQGPPPGQQPGAQAQEAQPAQAGAKPDSPKAKEQHPDRPLPPPEGMHPQGPPHGGPGGDRPPPPPGAPPPPEDGTPPPPRP